MRTARNVGPELMEHVVTRFCLWYAAIGMSAIAFGCSPKPQHPGEGDCRLYRDCEEFRERFLNPDKAVCRRQPGPGDFWVCSECESHSDCPDGWVCREHSSCAAGFPTQDAGSDGGTGASGVGDSDVEDGGGSDTGDAAGDL